MREDELMSKADKARERFEQTGRTIGTLSPDEVASLCREVMTSLEGSPWSGGHIHAKLDEHGELKGFRVIATALDGEESTEVIQFFSTGYVRIAPRMTTENANMVADALVRWCDDIDGDAADENGESHDEEHDDMDAPKTTGPYSVTIGGLGADDVERLIEAIRDLTREP